MRRRFIGSMGCATLLTLASACTPDGSVQNLEPLETDELSRSQALLTELELGQGIRITIDPPTTNDPLTFEEFATPAQTCLDTSGREVLTDLAQTQDGNTTFNAFTIDDELFLEPMMDRYYRGYVPWRTYSQELEELLGFASGAESTLLIHAAIKTTRKELLQEGADDIQFASFENAVCDREPPTSPIAQSFYYYDFYEQCGHRYVSRLDRAVQVMLVADISNYSQQEYDFLTRVFNQYTRSNELSFDEAMKELLEYQESTGKLAELKFRVEALTPDPVSGPALDPSVSLVDENGLMTPKAWPEYVAQIRDGYQASSPFGPIRRPDYGEIYAMRSTPYPLSRTASSCLGADVTCSAREHALMFQDAYEFFQNTRSVEQRLRYLKWIARNPNAVEGLSSDEHDRYSEYSSLYSRCMSAWVSQRRRCASALGQGGVCTDPDVGEPDFCETASIIVDDPNTQLNRRYECTSEGIDSALADLAPERLTPSQIIPPPDGDPQYHQVQGHRHSVDSTADRFCALGRVAGALNGMGEKVRVSNKHLGGQYWTLETATKVDPADHDAQLVGGMWCVEESTFRDTSLPTTFHQDSMSVAASGPNDGTLYSDRGVFQNSSFRYMSFVNGVQGRFNGLGESVEFDGAQGEATVATHKKDIVGYFSQFGVNAPRNGGWARARDLDGETAFELNTKNSTDGALDKKLSKVSDGVCVLTGLAGRFDGKGESVTLRQDDSGYWEMHLKAACERRGGFGLGECEEYKNVRARAMCYAYDQD